MYSDVMTRLFGGSLVHGESNVLRRFSVEKVTSHLLPPFMQALSSMLNPRRFTTRVETLVSVIPGFF